MVYRLAPVIIASLIVAAFAAPAAWAHDVSTAAGHQAEDAVVLTASQERALDRHTRATVWDPATGSQTSVNLNDGFNIFCSGLAHLFDGRLFIAGGNKDQALNGIVQTHLFDPATNGWSRGPDMAGGRWYPTVTPLR